MKRVFRIQGKGKVKDIGLRGLGEYPQVDHLDAKHARNNNCRIFGMRMLCYRHGY